MNETSASESDQFLIKLKEFYESGQYQQKVSFWVSVGAVSLGFMVILLSLVMFLKAPEKITQSVILAISGVVSEFIAAAFFYIHNKSVNQLNTYFQNLIKLQDTNIAIDLVQRMPESNRAYMYMNIINVLILRNEPNRELTPELVKALRQVSSDRQ